MLLYGNVHFRLKVVMEFCNFNIIFILFSNFARIDSNIIIDLFNYFRDKPNHIDNNMIDFGFDKNRNLTYYILRDQSI